MKTTMKNEMPWAAIRWMAAGVVYLLTLAIAFDQVKTRDEKIEKMRAGAKQIQQGLAEIRRNSDANISDTQLLIEKLEAEQEMENQRVIGVLRKFSEPQR